MNEEKDPIFEQSNKRRRSRRNRKGGVKGRRIEDLHLRENKERRGRFVKWREGEEPKDQKVNKEQNI